jgi:hypothetical protein
MPKMTVTEEEACLIREDRKVKALQAVAWNEAVDACITVVYRHVLNEGNPTLSQGEYDTLRADLLKLLRPR